jgi:protein tyrosine phosphatase (PTP) superfamily phosphohydrolase (DUF442 family)
MRRTLAALATSLAVGNLAIAVVSAVVRRTAPNEPLPPTVGVKHLHAVDADVWRSSAPSREASGVLAERGVRTVVDLRAERDLRDDEPFLAARGVRLARLPIRDGQTPTPAQVEHLLQAIGEADGLTLIHCGAGVGRTGAMVGAYLVTSRTGSPGEALRRNLAVGPPSLEQIWYVARLGHGCRQPPIAVKVVSRTLDAPRRIWSRIRHAR